MDRLGAGGMAEVFRALVLGPEQFQRLIVVKRILPSLCANPSFIKMFIDEATLCGRLSHPNIIQVHEFGRYDDHYFIAMEYLHGRSLNNILGRLVARDAGLPINIAADIMRQTCRGLAYAHGLKAMDGKPLGIIHRDISPGNVMVAYSGVVKVVDFGVARVENRFRLGSTDPGHVKGKSSYLAPEQVTGEGADHRADIFSAGILLHEMLTAKRLFKADNPMATVALVRNMSIAPPSHYNPEVPPKLDAIVMRALERQRSARYQDAGQMAADLEAFLIEQKFTSQELPAFMHALFEDESASHQLQLDSAALAALAAADAAEAEQHLVPVATSTGSAGAASASGSAGSSATVPAAVAEWPELDQLDELEGRPRPRAGGAGLKAAVVVAALAAGAIWFLAGRSGDFFRAPAAGPPAATSAVVAPSSPAAPVNIPVAAGPPAAPSRSVKISISSEPAGATVLQDSAGKPVGVTPLEVTLPRSDRPVVFRISKPGHVEGVLSLVPDTDRPALVTLARSASVRRSRNPEARTQKVRNAVPIDPFAP